MLERTHQGRHARRGPRPVVRPKLGTAATTFNGIYMRPNLQSTGTVPSTGDLTTCPDIWIAGATPVAGYQTALATTQSYASQSSNDVHVGYDNYIYVRGCNGAQTTLSNTVELFYAGNAIIPWPGDWQPNTIATDQGNGQTIANINGLAPGAIGVADATFLWSEVPPPPSGSSHYCLIAWLNDANNSNPFPSVYSQLDMSALVTNNLGWGWRNVVEVSSSLPTWSYEMNLTIPQGMAPATYYLYVNPTGFNGWNVEFTCSQTDANGAPIALRSTKIQQDGQVAGVTCVLQPGFNATVTIYMYSNGIQAPAGASIPLTCSYPTTEDEATRAIDENLVDWTLQRQLKRAGVGVGPTPWVPLGSMNYAITQ